MAALCVWLAVTASAGPAATTVLGPILPDYMPRAARRALPQPAARSCHLNLVTAIGGPTLPFVTRAA